MQADSQADNHADSQGEPDREWLGALYGHLRSLAEYYMRHERRGHTLQPTALLHEVYLRMHDQAHTCNGRLQFMRVAAQVMRNVLVDHARGAATAKRGGDWRRCDVEALTLIGADGASVVDALALEEALTQLEKFNPRHARIVELHFYCGLSLPEVAEVIQCSLSTIEKDWRAARAWLHNELEPRE